MVRFFTGTVEKMVPRCRGSTVYSPTLAQGARYLACSGRLQRLFIAHLDASYDHDVQSTGDNIRAYDMKSQLS